ncbi:MAG: PAS domain S-box protein [Ignavibacteriae bacterium]|nr:MAG: PAS domain S-box protein [Ignavibacteriota bacterium]
MVSNQEKPIKSSSDLKDIILVFSIIIIVLVIAAFFDLFEYLSAVASNPEGFKIVELLFVFTLFGFAYGFFTRRRWKESNLQIKELELEYEEIKDNANRLKSTVDLSPDAIVVHRDSHVMFVNKAALTLFGVHAEEEIIGKEIKQLLHYSFYDIVATRIERMTKYMKQVPPLDIIARRLDNSYIDVSIASTPVYYHAIPHIITILRDITDRKKTEEIRSRLASIVLNSNDAIYGINLDGTIQSWNPGAERLYGYKEKEIIGLSASILSPDRNLKVVDYFFEKLEKGEKIESYETKQIKKDKNIIDASITVSLLKESSGITIGASAIARDITFKKRVEEELRRYAEELALSNEELYVFSYAASHDLQEPLRTIQAFINLLKEKHKKKLNKEVDGLIDSAEDGVIRMHRLITDFLMYSRVGSQAAVMEPTDCNLALKDALSNLEVTIKESKAVIKHLTLPKVRGNMVQLTQVFQNLISNAIKYQGEKPAQIEISAERRDCEWLFAVKDNGIGIEQWFSERIFIVFQKLHDHKKYPGSGIGLALCKRVIEKHGGKIWFESEIEKGTTFFFTLPVLEEKK